MKRIGELMARGEMTKVGDRVRMFDGVETREYTVSGLDEFEEMIGIVDDDGNEIITPFWDICEWEVI